MRRLTLVFVSLLWIFWTAAAPSAAQTQWTGEAGDGLWSSPGNWSTGEVPNEATDVVFDLGTRDAYVVQVQTSREVGSLTLTSSTLRLEIAEVLRVNGASTWQQGTIAGEGVWSVAGGLIMQGGASASDVKRLDGARMLIPGGSTARMSATNFFGGNGAVVQVDPSGTFVLDATIPFRPFNVFSESAALPVLQNDGTVRLASTDQEIAVEWAIENQGLIETTSAGVLRLNGPLTDGDGTYRASAGRLEFSSDGTSTVLGAESVVEGAGEIAFTGSSTVTLSGSYDVTGATTINTADVTFAETLTLENFAPDRAQITGDGRLVVGLADGLSVSNLELNRGTLEVAGPLSVSGPLTLINADSRLTVDGAVSIQGLFTWTGGTIDGAGTVTAGGGALLNGTSASANNVKRLDGTRLVIPTGATGTVTGRFVFAGNGAVLEVQPGAVLDVQPPSPFRIFDVFSSSTSAPTLQNAGTVRYTTSTDPLVDVDWNLVNSGLVEVLSPGTLRIEGDVTDQNGTYRASSGALQFQPASGAAFAFQSESLLDGAGTIGFGAGQVTILGDLNVSGTLRIGLPSTNNTAQVTVDPSATISGLGTRLLKLDDRGTLRVQTATAPAIDSLDVDFQGVLELTPDLSVTGGVSMGNRSARIVSDANLTVGGPTLWEGGYHEGAGTTRLNGDAQFTGSIGSASWNKGLVDGRQLILSGGTTARYESGRNFTGENGAELLVEAGATLEIVGPADFTEPSGSDVAPRLVNRGTIRKDNTDGDTRVFFDVTNQGLIEVVNDVLRFGANVTGDGTYRATDPGELRFASRNNGITFPQASTIEGSGTVHFQFVNPVSINGTYDVSGRTRLTGSGSVNRSDVTFEAGSNLVQLGGWLDLGTDFESGGIARVETTAPLTVDQLSLGGSGELYLTPDLTVTGTGSLGNRGTFVAGTGNLTVQGAFAWKGGFMSGSATTRLEGGVTFTGSAGSASWNKGLSDGRQLVIAGGTTASYQGSRNFTGSNGAGLLIEPGATFEVRSSADLAESSGSDFTPTITNRGTFRKSGTEGDTRISFTLANEGVLDAAGDVLDVRADLQNTGTIQGTATLRLADATVTNQGVIAPGGTPGRLTVDGPLGFGAGSMLDVEVAGPTAGTGYDQLTVTGAAALGETLRVQFQDGAAPAVGDTYAFVDAASRTGTFADVQVSGLPAGQRALVRYTPSGAVLEIGKTGPVLAETPWPMQGQNAGHTGVSPVATPNQITTAWEFSPPQAFVGQPALGADGTIYAASPTGFFWAVNPDGTEKWRIEGLTSRSSPAVASDGTIYAVTQSPGALSALDPAGTVRWTVSFPDIVVVSPTIGPDGSVYVAANDGVVRAVNADGSIRWATEIPDTRSILGSPTVTPDGSTVLVGTTGPTGTTGGLVALSSTGELLWKAEIGDDPVYTPSIGPDGTIYAGSPRSVAAVSPTGEVLWTRTGPSIFGYASVGADGRVYARDVDAGALLALDGATGATIWSAALDGIPTPPTLTANDRLVVATRNASGDGGALYVLDADGSVISQLALPDVPQTSPILTGDGLVVLAATDFLLAAQQAQGPELSVSPTTIDFGIVPVGTTASQVLTLTNTGDQTLTIDAADVTLDAGTGAPFAADATFPVEVSPFSSGSLTLTYTPSEAASTSATLSFTSNSTTNPGTVSLQGTGTSTNAPPSAVDDVAETSEDTPVVVDVLANDSDPNDDPLTILEVTSPGDGAALIVSTGVEYTPNAGFTGTDTFSYTVGDGQGGTATAQVSVTVNATTGNVAGSVRTFSDESPIAGASVRIDAVGLATTTDADGAFQFSGLDPGTYSVSANATGFDADTQNVTVTAGETAFPSFFLSASSGAVRWTGQGDGASWSDGANWSTGSVPTATDDVLVDLDDGTNYTISVDAAFEAASLRITTGRAQLSVDNPLTISGGLELSAGRITGASTLDVGGALTFTGGTLAGSGTVQVAGPFSWSGGSMAGTGRTLANGTATIRAEDGSFFPDRPVRERTLVFNGNATLEAGSLNLLQGAVVRIAAGTVFTVATDDTGLRSLSDTSPTPLLDVQGTIVKTGGSGINAVFIGQDGRTRVDVTGTIRSEQGNVQMEPSPESVLSGTFEAGASTSFSWSEGGTVTGTLTGDGRHNFFNPYVIEGTIDLPGTLSLSRTQTVAAGATVAQLGTLRTATFFDDQLITFAAAGPSTIGTLNVEGTLRLQSDVVIANRFLLGVDDQASLTGPGAIRVDTDAEMQWGTGVLAPGGTVQVDGTLTSVVAQYLDGDFTVQRSAKTLRGRRLVVAGPAAWDDAPLSFDEGGLLEIAASGQFDVQRDASFEVGPDATGEEALRILGTFRKTGVGSRTSSGADPITYNDVSTGTAAAVPIQNEGTLSIEAGTLAPVTLRHTGRLQGSGTLDLSNPDATFDNQGIVAPGRGTAELAGGRLSVTGTYDNASSTLQVDLAGTGPGTGYDQLAVTGAATLGGTLDLSVLAPFDPPAGSSYTILTAESVSGTFTTVNLPDLSGRTVDVDVEAAQVVVRVNAAVSNAPPVAEDDLATTPAGTPVAIDVLANDSDPDDDPLTISSLATPENGTAQVVDGGIQYTSTAGFVGTDSFPYTISDGRGGTAEALVTVEVTEAPNTAPLAEDDAATTTTGTPVAVDVLANDSDPDDDPLTIASVGEPINGTAQVVDGGIQYTPDTGFIGTDAFPYTITDGRGGTAEAVVTVEVTEPPNTNPIAEDDVASTTEEVTVVVDVLANDSDPDGDPLSITSASTPETGSAEIVSGGIAYTPAPGFVGSVTFTYTIGDGRGGSDQAAVTVEVTDAPNEPPVAADDNASATSGIPVAIDVLANDTDPDGDPLTLAGVSTPANGTAQIQDGQVVYTSESTFSGTDTFTYTVADGRDGRSTGTVTVTVERPNRPPTAVDDDAFTVRNTPVTLNPLANDSDPDGDPLRIASVTEPSSGQARTDGETITYEPQRDFTGTDAFTYLIDDGRQGTAEARVTITVSGLAFQITDLGTTGGPVSRATAINSTGTVTGVSIDAGGTAEGFVWDDGQIRPLADGATPFLGFAISEDGTVAGYVASGSSAEAAVVSPDGSVQRLGTLGGGYSVAYGITDGTGGAPSSLAAVGTAETSTGVLNGFTASSGQMSSLGTFGGASSEAFDVSPTGVAVGVATQPDGRTTAFVGGQPVAGTQDSRAYAITPLGVAAGSRLEGTAVRPVLWLPDRTAVALPTGESTFGEVYDVSDIGWAVGAVATGAPEASALMADSPSSGTGSSGTPDDPIARLSPPPNGTADRPAQLRDEAGLQDSPEAGTLTSGPAGAPGTVHADAWRNNVRSHVDRLLAPGQTSAPADLSKTSGSKALSADLRATLWLDEEPFDLNDLIPNNSGWTLLEARAVNEQGQIVGTGVLQGQERAFLLTPVGNAAPTAADDAIDVESGSDVVLALVDNDYDADGDALRVVRWTRPRLGTLTRSDDPSALVYRASPGTHGTDQFEYVVTDAYGGTATASVVLNVAAGVDPEGDVELVSSGPNPASSRATIRLVLPRAAHVRLTVYDVLGRRTARLVDATKPAGRLTVPVDVSGWAPGSYFYRIHAGDTVLQGRMNVVR